jgi:hypothetical protein
MTQSRIMCPKKIDGEFMGFYKFTDIAKHETGRVHSEGVEVLKVRLEACRARNKLLSSGFLEHGAKYNT